MIAGTYRANPAYELVLIDRLDTTQRAALDVHSAADVYGVLQPRPDSGLVPRAVSHETALLFLTLQRPGTLPSYVVAKAGPSARDVIARLVFDGVLEIATSDGFVTGPTALGDRSALESAAAPGRLSTMSVDAVRWASRLRGLTTNALALRLYGYGRRPISPQWSRRLSSTRVPEYLGLSDPEVVSTLEARWLPQADEHRSGWLSWDVVGGRRARTGAGYKLYVSPDLDGLPRAWRVVLETLAYAPGVRSVKVGADLAGVSRPDKMVAYFTRLEDLQAAARTLERELRGVHAHGVPFTSAITSDGLLSCGIDPPKQDAAHQATRSWRFWVVTRLAEYLVAATSVDDDVPPWQRALDRLALDGVDTRTWAPTVRLWANES